VSAVESSVTERRRCSLFTSAIALCGRVGARRQSGPKHSLLQRWGEWRSRTEAASDEAELVRLKVAMRSLNSDRVIEAVEGGSGGSLDVRLKNLAEAASIVWCPMCWDVQRMQNLTLQSAHHIVSSKLPCPGLLQKPELGCAPDGACAPPSSVTIGLLCCAHLRTVMIDDSQRSSTGRCRGVRNEQQSYKSCSRGGTVHTGCKRKRGKGKINLK
jgi:hypothetical protein